MAVTVRINEDNYQALKELADKERRSVVAQLDVLLDDYFNRTTVGNVSPEIGLPQKITEVETPRVDDLIKQTKPKTRNKGDILADIRALEAKRDEELRYCQDIDVANQITDAYAEQLNILWDEYQEAE